MPRWCAALNTGFHNPAGDVDAEARRAGLYLDRTWAGFDGEKMVATLRSFPTAMTVPGGATVKASAVTAVTTTSTHRRRGLASRLIAGELATATERGEMVSVLIAAEWGIYGRFGYGPATEHQSWTLEASVARIRQRVEGSVEYVDRETARAVAPDIYERHRLRRPGEIARPERFWDIDLGTLRYPSWPEPKAAFFVLARAADGTVVGLARYECTEKWEHRIPSGHATVTLLVAGNAVGERLLWDHLVNLDLVARLEIADRAPDELLPWLLTDARHARPSDRSDFLWIRPLDVAGLLAARSYLVAGRVVVEVVDRSGLVAGRFDLDGGPDAATCRPTDASPDLTVDISTLASMYLGGFSVRTLDAAGLVDEHSARAVATADAMFRSPVAPWCSTWF